MDKEERCVHIWELFIEPDDLYGDPFGVDMRKPAGEIQAFCNQCTERMDAIEFAEYVNKLEAASVAARGVSQ